MAPIQNFLQPCGPLMCNKDKNLSLFHFLFGHRGQLPTASLGVEISQFCSPVSANNEAKGASSTVNGEQAMGSIVITILMLAVAAIVAGMLVVVVDLLADFDRP